MVMLFVYTSEVHSYTDNLRLNLGTYPPVIVLCIYFQPLIKCLLFLLLIRNLSTWRTVILWKEELSSYGHPNSLILDSFGDKSYHFINVLIFYCIQLSRSQLQTILAILVWVFAQIIMYVNSYLDGFSIAVKVLPFTLHILCSQCSLKIFKRL